MLRQTYIAFLFGLSAFAQFKSPLTCEVAIIGGGAGGLHTAYRLGPQLGNKVCLFEKETRLGGRIYDIPKDDKNPNSPVFGAGALRVMETQDVVFGLAKELGIQFESVGFENDLIIARGQKAPDSDALRAAAYPKADTGGESALYDQIRSGPLRKQADKYPDMRAYMRAAIGGENHSFMSDVFRFRADFTAPVSASSYLDFLDEDWDVCCTPSYPVGGMSEFIKRMEQRALQAGVRIYKGQPALTIAGNSGRYEIITTSYNVQAAKIVIAVDAEGFKKVGGTVATRIQQQPQFQDLLGIKVVTITQWWPNEWWKGVVPGHRVWSTQHCLNFMEIPNAKYAADQMVTRTVYNDDLTCSEFWENLAKRGTAEVEAEIERELKDIFPTARVPKPSKTVVQIWPAGWYWLRGGSPYSNADIAAWAVQPLRGEQISLVGESYNPQRSTWSDGAYKSSINTLNTNYGFRLSGQTADANGAITASGSGKSPKAAVRPRGRN